MSWFVTTIFAFVFSFSVVAESTSPTARRSTPFGELSNVGVWVKGLPEHDYAVNVAESDIEGSLVVYGVNKLIRIRNYKIGAKFKAGVTDMEKFSVIAGAKFDFQHGSIPHGDLLLNAMVGSRPGETVNFSGLVWYGGHKTDPSLYVNQWPAAFVNSSAFMQEVSASWVKLKGKQYTSVTKVKLETGKVIGNALELVGEDPALNVFEWDTRLMKDTGELNVIYVSAPVTSSVVINVLGETVNWKNVIFKYEGVTNAQVAYHFPNCKTLYFNDFDFQGTLVAPNCRGVFKRGKINGQVFIGTFEGDYQVNYVPYQGAQVLSK